MPSPCSASPPVTLRVLTVNTHKGFAFLGRRFVLSELRDAVREVGADLVFLQEVQGSHAGNSASVAGWPQAPHYEYLADALWPEFAYGRNAVYPHGHHGNAVLSKYPIIACENRDVSVDGHETRGLLHCTLRVPGHPLLAAQRFDLIVANPPYIAAFDPHLQRGDLRAEPVDALVAGPDGLECIRAMVAAAPRHLNSGGSFALEHGHDQAARCRELLEAAGLEDVFSRNDIAGIARVSGGLWRRRS